ncbi:MAG: VWA domain-containing protein [Verrucomicrobia bacterium]|nr:VWA domain-containing protein [Verrucomicrobiota bacterium]
MKPEQITAWALNQLTAEEAAELEAKLHQNPDEQTEAVGTQEFCQFLSSELKDDSLALTEAQRQRLMKPRLEVSKPASLSFKPKPLQWWQRPAFPMAAAAAVIVFGVGAGIYLPSIQESTADQGSLTASDDERAVEIRMKLPSLSQVASKPEQKGVLTTPKAKPKSTSDQIASMSALDAPESLLASGAELPPSMMQKQVGTDSIVSEVKNSEKIGYGGLAIAGTSTATMGGTIIISSGKLENSVGAIFDPPQIPTNIGGDHQTNTDSYGQISENALTSVSREPLSTFSIDVDTASYSNVRRFLNLNTQPPRDAVRIEELINYFPTEEPGPEPKAKQPFAVKVEMASCPWQPQHRLARIHLKGRDLGQEHKASNLVFLVDVSGSMSSPEKLTLVQRSLRLLTERLNAEDHVALVTYAGGTEVVLPPTNGTQKATIIAAIDRLQSGGSTHGSAGIQLAYEQASKAFIKGGVNRVILCTDGDFNVGISTPKELENLIQEKARSGVFLSVLGYGRGNLKDHTMETLADKGNGNYAYIDSISEARKVLVEQMQGTLVTIAKDVKIQVEFNPAAVRDYRLIGYENRLLAKEDFNDDRKDAGEIGAGHSVTALYEIVPANLKPGESPVLAVDPLKYQPEQMASPLKSPVAPQSEIEALTVKLRYKEPEGVTSKLIEVPLKDDTRQIDKASAELKFSAAVAGFGLMLRDSSYKGELTWSRVRQLAREGKGKDALGYRGEFLQLIEKASGGKN